MSDAASYSWRSGSRRTTVKQSSRAGSERKRTPLYSKYPISSTTSPRFNHLRNALVAARQIAKIGGCHLKRPSHSIRIAAHASDVAADSFRDDHGRLVEQAIRLHHVRGVPLVQSSQHDVV